MDKVKLFRITIICLVLLNVGVLSFLCFRQGPRDRRGPRGEEPKLIIIRKLHFDQAQQDAYQALIAAHRRQTMACDDRSRSLKGSLYKLLKNPAPDTVVVKAAIRKIGLVQEEQEQVNFKHFQDIRKLCKPEQVKDFDELVNELTGIFMRHDPPPHK